MLKKNFLKSIIISLILIISFHASSQTDSITFHNGNYMVGQVKTMTRGVLTVKTPYSDSDFKIEWKSVKEIFTNNYYLITLSDGSRYNGSINSIEPGIIKITYEGGQELTSPQENIVWLDDLDKGFWSQLYASIDIGFDLAKANNLRQLSSRTNIGYMAKRWNVDGTYNSLYSVQNNTDKIERTDGGLSFKYFLPRDWYPVASLNFFTNSEQKLQLRTSGQVGMGKYVIHTNAAYWGFILGVNYNQEIYYTDSIPGRNSMEGLIGTELNLFDIGDLNLMTKVSAYPSFTESGRWRTDIDFDARYEMPFDDDFYIKMGFTFNYDNQPVEGASDLDYVLHTGFGWEW